MGLGWITTRLRMKRREARASREARDIQSAHRIRATTEARVVTVTGSSAKSTTVGLISHVLSARETVPTLVYHNIRSDIEKTFLALPADAKFVVLELGVIGIGDMQPMADAARPDVAVITLVGREHYSAFRSREAVALEKGALVAAVPRNGLVVLNADDDLVMAMAARSQARIVTFGEARDADYRVADVDVGYPRRLTVTIEGHGESTVVQTLFAGAHHLLPVAAAFATACELGIDRATIAARIATFQPSFVRGRVVPVEGGPTFIVDSVKAPYDTLSLSFDMIGRATAPRKRIVLGQISDYPGSARNKYRNAYRQALAAADEVIFVGENSHRSGASPEDRESGRFFAFDTPREVAEHIRRTHTAGELILLKGSGNLHLERIALDWLTDVACWIPACGLKSSCGACGYFGMTYEAHVQARKKRRRWEKLKRLFVKENPIGTGTHRRRFDGPANEITD